MDQAAAAEVVSYNVTPEGDATFVIFVPVELMEQPHVLDLNVITDLTLTEAKASDESINYDPERPFTIGWAVGLQNLIPTPVGPVDLEGNVTKDWKGINYHQNLEPDTHHLHGEVKGDLNGLLELKGVNIGIERVVTHL